MHLQIIAPLVFVMCRYACECTVSIWVWCVCMTMHTFSCALTLLENLLRLRDVHVKWRRIDPFKILVQWTRNSLNLCTS